jgi:hypothetical protein
LIEFLCPEGHKIRCPDEQAGKSAKCPRCGAKFRIPDPTFDPSSDPPAASPSPVSDSVTDLPPMFGDLALSDAPMAEPPVPTEPEPAAVPEMGPSEIEFLCPNGHRLHGPSTLQGRPGECPECGSKFRIPRCADVAEGEEDTEVEVDEGRLDGDTPADAGMAGFEEIAESEFVPAPADSAAYSPGGAHTFAELFTKLWAERSRGAVVELHLADGTTLTPDDFAASRAGQGHGLFAVREADGTYALSAVAWDSIARVVVRQVRQLPDWMSD